MKVNCCDPIYWKHEDGWDVYLKSNCRKINGQYVPNWFDDFVIEDMPTKSAAIKQIMERHIFGLCLVSA